MSKIELPPLPRPVSSTGEVHWTTQPVFTADQLRARDRQIVEVCAQIADEQAKAIGKGCLGYATASTCAAAIRNLIEESNNG